MDKILFNRLAETYGADIEKWPPQYQSEAHQFLQSHLVPGDAFIKELALNALLDTAPRVMASADLRRRIRSIPASQTRDSFTRWFTWKMQPYAAAFAMLACVGVWTGSGPMGAVMHSQTMIDGMIAGALFGPMAGKGEIL